MWAITAAPSRLLGSEPVVLDLQIAEGALSVAEVVVIRVVLDVFDP